MSEQQFVEQSAAPISTATNSGKRSVTAVYAILWGGLVAGILGRAPAGPQHTERRRAEVLAIDRWDNPRFVAAWLLPPLASSFISSLRWSHRSFLCSPAGG